MLPTDLYRDIIESLDHDYDRTTLLATAQCCALLRVESQRILFRSTTGRIWHGEDQVQRYKLFLEAILGAPKRLALYVRDLDQRGIGWEPGYMVGRATNSFHYKASAQVYKMTGLALPIMVNLKRLSFKPFRANPSAHILCQCTFQLEVFEWWQPNCESELVSSFFPHQNALRHITVFWQTDTKLPNNILPKLMSVRGSLSALIAFTEAMGPGKTLAFDYLNTNGSTDRDLGAQRVIKALHSIQYLRTPIEHHLPLISQGNTLPESIVLLDITLIGSATNVDFLNYTPPTLRALVLRRHDWPQSLSQHEMDRMALAAFIHCPSLQYVDIFPIPSARAQRIPRPRPGEVAGESASIAVTFLDEEKADWEWWERHSFETETSA
ncbi:hypothetical protein D9619_012856 [Psilocybe cf. subviscida]|uniref:Uncharacterized protein n=1 Tax=Psilocybe cf. subviscida TaxID=2480587 RepID=A0A8H5BJQ5_9AGAR|nr:hypothetical protein D9619_012856 [Psilocybe cf. subviscida]